MAVSHAQSAELTASSGTRVVEGRRESCLNCGEVLHGAFCSACGQRDIPPSPTSRELARDAFEDISGWDGRFASTIRALIAKPGMLTREFLEGRRARYITPVRLYLAASVVYFLLAAGTPTIRLDSGQSLFLGVHIGSDTLVHKPSTDAERLGIAARESIQKGGITDAERAAALQEIARAPKLLRPLFRRVVDDPIGFRRSVVAAMPRMLFVLLPLFAIIVSVFYRGRRYPEHLAFALHLHAFIFFALGVSALSKYSQIPIVAIIGGLTALIWIPVYATVAFRRVYGSSVVGTLAREIGIAVLYCTLAALAFAATIYWASVN